MEMSSSLTTHFTAKLKNNFLLLIVRPFIAFAPDYWAIFMFIILLVQLWNSHCSLIPFKKLWPVISRDHDMLESLSFVSLLNMRFTVKATPCPQLPHFTCWNNCSEGWDSLPSACFNTSNFSLWTQPLSQQDEHHTSQTSGCHPLCPRMSLLQGVLCQVLSWAGVCQVLCVVGTGLAAVVAAWTVRLLVRHAWYTHRLSCFSKPHADYWLIGHLGQVGPTHQGWRHTH